MMPEITPDAADYEDTEEIKVGDLVRYAPGDIMPLQGVTGKVVSLHTYEYEDLKVDCATVEYAQRPVIRKHSTALVNLTKVAATPAPEIDMLRSELTRWQGIARDGESQIVHSRNLLSGMTRERDMLRSEIARLREALSEARDSLLDIRDLAKPYEHNDNFTFSRIISHADYGLAHSEEVATRHGMEKGKRP